jgi:hypothetical protein
VQLDNGFTDGNGFEFVVDDSQGGAVNFYIPDNSTVNINNNSRIWTKAYKEAIESGSYDVNFYKTTTDSDGNEVLDLDASGNVQILKTEHYDHLTLYGTLPKFSDFSKYIPGINIYSGENNATFNFTNNSFMTGYILAPYAKGSVSTGGISLNISYADNINQTLVSFNNVSTQVIGAVVVGSGFNTANASTFIFVSKDSSSSNSGTKTMANGDSIKMYQSTYQNSY